MRRLLLLAASLVLATAARAEFPEVSKLPSHADLPDPLVMLDGGRVTTREQWLDKRRPELKNLLLDKLFPSDAFRAKQDSENADRPSGLRGNKP